MRRMIPVLLALAFAGLVAAQGAVPVTEQGGGSQAQARDLREQLATARAQQRSARLRAERLEAQTRQAEAASIKAQRQAAALAARVQQAEARLAGQEAELSAITSRRRVMAQSLARQRAPVAGLVAALETVTRRPPALALLQEGSVRDLVLTRAVLAGALPHVEMRTAGLRERLEAARQLEAQMVQQRAVRQSAQRDLEARRRTLESTADAQRVRAARAINSASREAARARVLAREAADLDGLLAGLAKPATAATNPSPARGGYIVPVNGQLIQRFARQQPGLQYRVPPGALAVAPASGRVAFAGPYEGYGTIVILAHEDGRTSLLTGLGAHFVTTGQSVIAGAPIGPVSSIRPQLGWEVRSQGRPIDPLTLVE